jgi:hypothetical protein
MPKPYIKYKIITLIYKCTLACAWLTVAQLWVIIPPLIERGLYCNHLVCPSVHTFVTDISASTGKNNYTPAPRRVYCFTSVRLSFCLSVRPRHFSSHQKRFPRYEALIWSMWPNIRSLPSIVAEKNVTKNVHICSMCIKIDGRNLIFGHKLYIQM